MKRTTMSSLCLSVLILSVCTVALAVPAKLLRGRPNFDTGAEFGYFVWHDQDGAHLRWTTKLRERRFSGTVRSNKPIEQLQRVRLEGPDWVVRTGPNGFKFSTSTDEGLDGVDFRTAGDAIDFELEVDGHRIEAQHIHLGAASAHPAKNPFSVRRQQ